MKKLSALFVLFVVAVCQDSARAQVPGLEGITNLIAGIDESVAATNFFGPGEIELRLGGVYVQETGEGGTLIAAEKWDLFTPNLCLGAETIQSGQRNAANFAYVGYRKLLGNTAGIGFVGAGYDSINSAPLGIVGLRVERRTSKHLGVWASVSYGFETKEKNSRGLVAGGGVSYAF